MRHPAVKSARREVACKRVKYLAFIIISLTAAFIVKGVESSLGRTAADYRAVCSLLHFCAQRTASHLQPLGVMIKDFLALREGGVGSGICRRLSEGEDLLCAIRDSDVADADKERLLKLFSKFGTGYLKEELRRLTCEAEYFEERTRAVCQPQESQIKVMWCAFSGILALIFIVIL